ncbi:MAG: hypothetical protein K2Y20_09485 [Sphingomonas sp.]|nr:hypothetical protein [Sphingomonas sp.]
MVVPEALQHVVELGMGIFESPEAARALQNNPLRMAFGMLKVVAFVMAIVAFARFHALGSVRAALLPGWRMVVTVVVAVVLWNALGFALQWVQHALDVGVLASIVVAVNWASQLLLLLPIIALLLDDRSRPVWQHVRRWPAFVAMALLLPLAFAPAWLLHSVTHRLALRTPFAADVALMAFDAVLIGLLASLTGAALVRGFRTGS